jgi:hypothetical protein
VVSAEKHEEVLIAKFTAAFIGLTHSLPGEKHSQYMFALRAG